MSDADAEDLERFMQYAGKRLVIGHLGSPANERKTQKEKWSTMQRVLQFMKLVML